ncbi:MAG: helix-turn-helix transcriptional regulator [Oscillospiraceae bacterium]|nr:helix-turn-helix transcriptional regulator [Oscillospiraceae bacterium]
MSFGNNLRMARKGKGITQDQLAEILNVSRQAVSKWESDSGFPETEKLLAISKELGVSLDFLMDNMPADPNEKEEPVAAPATEKKIMIATFDGSQTVNCLSVRYAKIVFPSKNEPSWLLDAVDRVGFFGAHRVILGWYEDEETVKKEMNEIIAAMEEGKTAYTLKYYTDVKISFLGTAKRK